MFQPPSPRVREVKHRGVIGPVRHAKERMVLMSDALHVLNEGLKSLFVGPMATAVPPLEVVGSSSYRVCVIVGLGFTSMMLSRAMSLPTVEKNHRFEPASTVSLASSCNWVAGVHDDGAVNSTR